MAPHYETFLYVSTASSKQLEPGRPCFFSPFLHTHRTHKVDPELIVINGVITLEATMAKK